MHRKTPVPTTNSRIRSFPIKRRRPRVTPGTWLLFGIAVVMLGGGAAAQFGDWVDPRLSVAASYLEAWGLEAGTVFIGGIVMLGLALSSRQQRVHAATILSSGGIDATLSEIGAELTEFRNKLYEFDEDQAEVRGSLRALRQHIVERSSPEHEDKVVQATYQVAGSLDTLHAKLDQRVGEAQENIVHAVDVLSSLVEASRDYLQETLEEGQQVQGSFGAEVRHVLSELSRMVSTPIQPQIVVQQAPGAEPPTVEVNDDTESRGVEAESEKNEPALGEHHDANAWFKGGESTEQAQPSDETREEESWNQVPLGEPDAPQPAPRDPNEILLGVLDRFDESGEDTAALQPEEELDPMSVLDGMERAMEADRHVETPTEVEQPPVAEEPQEHQEPEAPRGPTIVRLDSPEPPLPMPPAVEPEPRLDPNSSSPPNNGAA